VVGSGTHWLSEGAGYYITAWEYEPGAGLSARTPLGTIYVWAKLPAGQTSADYARRLLKEAALSVVPGAAYGPHGEGYLRLSLSVATERVREAMRRLRETSNVKREA